MKNNDMKNGFRKKGFYIYLAAGAVCVVALAAVCLNTFGQDNGSRQLEINEPSQMAEEAGETNTPEMPVADSGIAGMGTDTTGITAGNQPDTGNVADSDAGAAGVETGEDGVLKPGDEKAQEDEPGSEIPADSEEKADMEHEADSEDKPESPDNQEVPVMEMGDNISNLKFDQEAGLKWPVSGEVLMQYSADAAIYHKTLGQYKCNPALIIAAEEGANVCSAADAVVTKVSENEEIGKYVVTSIGDDYQIIYGQLDKIQVEKGTELKEGEIIGCIASPTKYYVQEGGNLYMKLKNADDTVDPMIFLD